MAMDAGLEKTDSQWYLAQLSWLFIIGVKRQYCKSFDLEIIRLTREANEIKYPNR